MTQIYRLAINRAEQFCFFNLTWGEGMELTAKVPYPHKLLEKYEKWRQAYYYYYRALPPTMTDDGDSASSLRGRAGVTGNVPVAHTELRGQLAQVGERLVVDLHNWLEQGELIEIRRQLNHRQHPQTANTLFIACDEMDLRRLPWESWELTTEFGQGPPIQIARQPVNVVMAANPPQKRRRKARVLVIIGDDTGLDFGRDLAAVAQLKMLVDIQVIGWQRGKNTTDLINEVRDEIRDPEGWDMLFFFGHSNEAAGVGGEIAIAPKTYLSMRDLESDLTEAKRNGLQFALFNSCKGLDIANQLVALGLNQVVIMREPIHNQVAQSFLLQFLKRLAQYEDVHTALQKATKALKAEQSMAFPSAYLVPSLFRHRGAELFQLQPVGLRARLSKLWPSRTQGVVLGAIAILSLLPPVQGSLIAGRLWTQALARQITTRPLQADVSPPVVLIYVDDKSIAEGIPDGDASLINRAYLAQLLDKAVELDSRVIGIDYLLDRQQKENNPELASSIKNAADQGSWLVFASHLKDGQEIGPQSELFNPDWAMQGYINAPPWYLKALPTGRYCDGRCPFSYLLAMTQATLNGSSEMDVVPSSKRSDNLRQDLFATIAEEANNPLIKELYHYRLFPVVGISRWVRQRWLHPILDFSIPPNYAYERIPAHEFLEKDLDVLRSQYDWQNKVILIGAGGYDESGIGNRRDYVNNPPAVQFWRTQSQDLNSRFTGVEGHAYTIHHFLNRHWLTPVPNLWMIALATVLGAGSALALQRDKRLRKYRWRGLLVFSIGYGLIGLVVYSTASIALPWLLPTVAVWVYHVPGLKHSNQERNL